MEKKKAFDPHRFLARIFAEKGAARLSEIDY
jgi:hypothetical protein